MTNKKTGKFLGLCMITLAVVAHAPIVEATIPTSERDALIALYMSTDGWNWTNNYGWLGGVGTECTWYGVTCDPTESTVVGLSLQYKGLTGTIPAEVGDLGGLENLQLNGNHHLEGVIPLQVGDLSNLRFLDLGNCDLSGEIPYELATLQSLATLRLRGNRLTGPIPPELGSLSSLTRIDLSNNHFLGEIPQELGNLTGVQEFKVDRNRLVGEIPSFVAEFCQSVGSFYYFGIGYNALCSTDPVIAASLDACGQALYWRLQTVPPAGVRILGVSQRFAEFGWDPIEWTGHGHFEVLVATTQGGPYERIPSTTILFDKSVTGAIIGPLEPDTEYFIVVRAISYPSKNPKNTLVSINSEETTLTTLPATAFFVSTSGNDLDDCLTASTACRTVQAAIDKATEGDEIVVGPGTFNEIVSIDKNLLVAGSPLGPTIIDGQQHAGSVITIGSGATVALNTLQITNGDASYGGGVFNSGGVLFVLNSEIFGNQAIHDGGAIHNHGGAIVIENSTIAENVAGSDAVVSIPETEVQPGAIGFVNSTLSGNISTDAFSRVLSPSTLMNSTVTENQAGPFGFIMDNSGSNRYQHLIITGNYSPNCSSTSNLGKLGHNVYDTDECGTDERWGDQFVPDVLLGPLVNNGGPTRTHALLPGSPAIDAGDNDGAPIVDQRGFFRPHDGNGNGQAVADIGAFEYGGTPGKTFSDGFESGDTSAWSNVSP